MHEIWSIFDSFGLPMRSYLLCFLNDLFKTVILLYSCYELLPYVGGLSKREHCKVTPFIYISVKC